MAGCSNEEQVLGTNRRYADSIDRRMDAPVAETIMRSGAPLKLSPAELQLHRYPLTRDPRPSKVRVWVRYPDAPLEVEALAVAWTSRAVAVKWAGPGGEEHRAWVWASAVERAD
jgi:hypothetical protein